MVSHSGSGSGSGSGGFDGGISLRRVIGMHT